MVICILLREFNVHIRDVNIVCSNRDNKYIDILCNDKEERTE